MSDLETTLSIQIEICLGLEWGDPNSKVEQTEENKATWERIAHRTKIAGDKGWIIDIPNELPDISDFPPEDIFVLPEE